MKESLVKRHMAGVRERKGGNIKKKLNMGIFNLFEYYTVGT